MIYILILIGCIIGAVIGMNLPVVPYTYSIYLAIAIVAALDSVFGGITAKLNKKFDMKIFLSRILCQFYTCDTFDILRTKIKY